MMDCFWCGEEYDPATAERCPQCSTDIDTKSIRVITPAEAEAEAAASGENGTTS